MDGQTALHRATSASQFNNITVLLDRDEELANIRDNDGNTALHLACNKADKRTVTTLLVRLQELINAIVMLFFRDFAEVPMCDDNTTQCQK